MRKFLAEDLARSLEDSGGEAVDLAGGMWGVKVDTGFVTPDGRTGIYMIIASNDDGYAAINYGDVTNGEYSDEWYPLGTLCEHATEEVAEWVEAKLRDFNNGAFIDLRFENGMKEIYKDIVEG